MKESSWSHFDGCSVHCVNEGGKVYRECFTESGYLLDRNRVYGIGAEPFVRAYNRRCLLDAEEVELLEQVA